jgi:hypothetical protein
VRGWLVWVGVVLVAVQAALAIWFRFFADDPLLATWHLLMAVLVAVSVRRGA